MIRSEILSCLEIQEPENAESQLLGGFYEDHACYEVVKVGRGFTVERACYGSFRYYTFDDLEELLDYLEAELHIED